MTPERREEIRKEFGAKPKPGYRWLSAFHCKPYGIDYRRFIVLGPLTDKKIEQYQKAGKL